MLVVCPLCQSNASIDGPLLDAVTCPNCGQLISTRTGSPEAAADSQDASCAGVATRTWEKTPVDTPEEMTMLPVQLGRYTVESLLGTGGFAKVYLATDERLGRKVAIKVPRAAKFGNHIKLKEFLEEARTASKLRHPGIVTVFDVDQFPSGLDFIVMEYIEGQPLSDLLQSGGITIRQAVEILAKVARAIHYAHGQGFVHRDLKPGNILIDVRGEPRVVDFGMAVHESGQAALRGDISGTPPYMSPEQFRGEVHRIDGRTDIWSLGVILYQLMTGRRPFVGDPALLGDEVLHKFPRPPRQVNDLIPPELEQICLTCLQKSVDQRYLTAKDLADDLDAWMKSCEVPAQSMTASVLAGSEPRWWQRIGFSVVLVAVGVLAAIAFKPDSHRGERVGLNDMAAVPPAAPALHAAKSLPRRLDDEPLHRAIPLIDENRLPKKLSWPILSQNDTFDFDPGEGRLSLVNPGRGCMIELGRTEADAIVIEAELSRTGKNSFGGLFWGWHESPESSGNYKCFSVGIMTYPRKDREGGQHLDVDLLDLTLVHPGEFQVMTRQGLACVDLTKEQQPGSGRISIEVSRLLGLQSVSWNGERFLNVPGKVHAILNSYPGRYPRMRSAGVFGILNSHGSLVVRNPALKLIMKGQEL